MNSDRPDLPAFAFFDRSADFSVLPGNSLPHWIQAGATYFVTFCLADSVPGKMIRRHRALAEAWAREKGFDVSDPTWRRRIAADPTAHREYLGKFRGEFDRCLDEGYGKCELAIPSNAQIVVDSLRKFEGSRSRLGPFVVMPNHVHALVGISDPFGAEELSKSWRSFSTRLINRRMRRRGRLWQREGFDHLVRSAESFERFRRYIELNPVRAGLRPGTFRIGNGNKDGGVD